MTSDRRPYDARVRLQRSPYVNAGSIAVLLISGFGVWRAFGWVGLALAPVGALLMGVLVALYLRARGRPWR